MIVPIGEPETLMAPTRPGCEIMQVFAKYLHTPLGT